MKKWNLLEKVTTPDQSTLGLFEHDGEYVLRLNGRELMSNKRHASELRLGELGGLACSRRPKARLLVGGLGLGYTLRGALAHAGPDAAVVVAELLPEVVAWNRDARYPLAARELADPRTQVAIGDVFDVITAASRDPLQAFDAILLDADNGTTAMTTAGNAQLYVASGVERVRAALRPGGTAIYWSATSEPELERLMARLGFRVRREVVRAYGVGGPKHTLVIGVLPPR